MDELKRERKMISSGKGDIEENDTEDIANFSVSALATEPGAKRLAEAAGLLNKGRLREAAQHRRARRGVSGEPARSLAMQQLSQRCILQTHYNQ